MAESLCLTRTVGLIGTWTLSHSGGPAAVVLQGLSTHLLAQRLRWLRLLLRAARGLRRQPPLDLAAMRVAVALPAEVRLRGLRVQVRFSAGAQTQTFALGFVAQRGDARLPPAAPLQWQVIALSAASRPAFAALLRALPQLRPGHQVRLDFSAQDSMVPAAWRTALPAWVLVALDSAAPYDTLVDRRDLWATAA